MTLYVICYTLYRMSCHIFFVFFHVNDCRKRQLRYGPRSKIRRAIFLSVTIRKISSFEFGISDKNVATLILLFHESSEYFICVIALKVKCLHQYLLVPTSATVTQKYIKIMLLQFRVTSLIFYLKMKQVLKFWLTQITTKLLTQKFFRAPYRCILFSNIIKCYQFTVHWIQIL